MKVVPDFVLEDHSTIYLLRPISQPARSWVDERIGAGNGFQPCWPTVVIEHRYVADIVHAINSAGMDVVA
jgi:hypothetical protein